MGACGREVRLRFRFASTAGLAAWLAIAPTLAGPNVPRPGDDATYRPSVLIVRGNSKGSGTIISSVEGETLILTASHVIDGSGPIFVEVHRFNLGLERTRDSTGFPRRHAASVAARDPDSDLAILRLKGQLAFPYVARIAPGDDPPPVGTVVTSIGFDLGRRQVGFTTRVEGVERIDLGHGRGARPFLATPHLPEVGRSGGGLFRPDGALVGVCVGRALPEKGRKFGLFTALANVRALIRSDEEIAGSMARSNARSRSRAR